MRNPKISLIVTVSCLALLWVALGSEFAFGSPEEDVYEFGAIFPMTGPAAFVGDIFTAAVNQAVDEINAKGGVGGTKLKAIIDDNKSFSAKGGADAMNKILLNKKIAYVIGSGVEPNLAAQPMAERRHVILINSGGSSSSLLGLPYLYNNHTMSRYMMPPVAEFLYENGFRKVASLAGYSDDWISMRDVFLETWKNLGGTLVTAEEYQLTDTDMMTQLAKIKAAKPEVILVGSVGLHTGIVFKQARESGITVPICDYALSSAENLIPAGEYAEGSYSFGTYLDNKTQLEFGRNFIKTFNEKYAPPKAAADWFNANAYENVYILVELIKRVRAKGGDPHDGAQLEKALWDKPVFPSVFGSGKLTFIEDHGVLKDVVIEIIKEGKPVVEKLVSAEELRKY